MKHYYFFTLFLTVLSLIAVVPNTSASNPLIEKACSNAPDKDLCIQSLTDSPAKEASDIKAIALSSINIANTQGSTVVTLLAEQLEDTESSSGVNKPALTDCSQKYKDAMMSLKNAIGSINRANNFDDQFFGDLNASLSGAMKSATTCGNGLKGSKGNDVMLDNNKVFVQDCDIALAVTDFWSKNH